jgi:subtilisin-like proprotein convertase family protein
MRNGARFRWLESLRRRRPRPTRARAHSATRWRGYPALRVEPLEDRTLPATTVFPSADVPVFLLDLDTVRSAIVVPESFTISDLDVSVKISHSFLADLDVFLIGPDGTRVELFTDIGGAGANADAILDDEAGALVAGAFAPVNGRFQPEGPLAAFDGKDAKGLWILEITDDAAADVGTLNSWSLSFQTASDFVPRPDLVSATFSVTPGEALYGDSIRVNYTLRNQGQQAAGPFRVDLLLSTAPGIDASDTLLTSFEIPGLAAASTQSGTLSVTLPGNLTPPEGFPAAGTVFLGLRVDAADAVAENDEANNANRAPGADFAPLTIRQPFGEIGGLAWDDADGDGERDPGEDALSGVTLYLDLNNDGRLDPAEPSATTDTSGVYTFSGLTPGDYRVLGLPAVGLRQTFPGQEGYGVTVGPGQIIDGIDFAFQSVPQPDLVGASFAVAEDMALWGDPVMVSYTVRNRGTAAAGPFFAHLKLSPDAVIDETDLLLASLDFTGLAAGESINGTLTVTLPAPSDAFPRSPTGVSSAFLGLILDPDNTVSEYDEANNAGQRRGADLDTLTLFSPLPSDNSFLPDTLDVPSARTGTLGAGGEHAFVFTLTDSGRLLASASATPDSRLDPRLTLLRDGTELVRSDDMTAADQASLIDQHLFAGTYILIVSDQDDSGGSYLLTATFTPATTPTEALPIGSRSTFVRVADLNADGHDDLVTVNALDNQVSVLLGNGDGSFQPERRFDVGLFPRFNAVADFNNDGRPDLATANAGSGDVSVLLGNGDGTFQPQRRLATGLLDGSVIAVDVNHDGQIDLVTANELDNDISVLLGNGDGTFQPQRRFAAGNAPNEVAAGDLNGDGLLDVVIANAGSNDVSILLGNGDGTFQPQQRRFTGFAPFYVGIADATGDGVPDLLTANIGGDDVTLLAGNGDGTFGPRQTFRVGRFPTSVTILDLNGDGIVDLVANNARSGDVSVLLGTGGGSFLLAQSFAAGDLPAYTVAGDFNEDGRPDIAVANGNTGTSLVTILLGNGDGTFQQRRRFAAGESPDAVVATDLDNDGRVDLVVANGGSGDITVLLGNGDGSFRPGQSLPAGLFPFAVAVADLNGDGRPDLAAANAGSGDVSVLLGNGDGTFQQQQRYAAGLGSTGLDIADTNGDGIRDIVVANRAGNVTVLRGKGDGTFQTAQSLPAGLGTRAVVAADLNGDGRTDLVALNGDSDDLSLFLGQPDGNFGPEQRLATGRFPRIIQIADLNRDGRADLVIADGDDSDVSVLLGNGDGTFQPLQHFAAGDLTASLALADFDGDGFLDVITANAFSFDASVLLGNGDGTFQPQKRFFAGLYPVSVAVADLNSDGLPDPVLADAIGGVTLLLNTGDDFIIAASDRTVDLRNTPQRGDLDGDGLADTLVMNEAGMVLFWRALPVGQGRFAPPVLLNLGHPGRDLALVRTSSGMALAISDLTGDTISLYTARAGGFTRTVALQAGRLPQRVAVADLNGDGLDDLVVANAAGDSVTIAFQKADQTFAVPLEIGVGVTPSDLAFADVDGENGLDVLVSNRSSGDVSILYNDPAHRFTHTARYRAGASVSGLQIVNGVLQPRSPEEPVSLVAGDFDNDGLPDVVVVSREAHRLTLLPGTPGGGFANPQEAFRLSTSGIEGINDRPGQAVAADFNQDGLLDVAVLMEDRGEIWLYLGNAAGGPAGEAAESSEPLNRAGWWLPLGDGTFRRGSTVSAGSTPTGLSAADLDGDGLLDLMVGNGFGDLLFILGNGDGTFRPFVRADQRVSFVATDLNGDGVLDVVLANQAADVASAQVRTPGAAFFVPGAFQQDGSNGLIGPGDVAEADLDGLYGTDLVFANSGSNNVLVYLRRPDGSFETTPRSFFVGSNPTALHIAQLSDDNGDGMVDDRDFLDLAVANAGSNDVSLLLGSFSPDGTNWTFRIGPRLRTGGVGANAVSSADINGDKVPDILAVNGQDGTMVAIPSISGSGFFDDANVTPIPVASSVLVQTVFMDATTAFSLTMDGAIIRFNPSTGAAASVFTSPAGREVNTLQPFAPGGGDTMLFTANRDGSVSVLMPTAGGTSFTEQFTVAATGLGNPSALEVLAASDGGVEVYLTDAGKSGVVVLRFGPEDLFADAGDFGSGLDAVLVPVGEGSLALAAVLLDGGSLSAAASGPGAGDFDPSLVFAAARQAASLPPAGTTQREPAEESDEVGDREEKESPGERALAFVFHADPEPGKEKDGEEDKGEARPELSEQPLDLSTYIGGVEEALKRMGWQKGKKVQPDAGEKSREPGQEDEEEGQKEPEAQKQLPASQPDAPARPPQTSSATKTAERIAAEVFITWPAREEAPAAEWRTETIQEEAPTAARLDQARCIEALLAGGAFFALMTRRERPAWAPGRRSHSSNCLRAEKLE